MNENSYRRLGESLLDEVLLRAGLAQTSAEPISVTVEFVVRTDHTTRSVVLRYDAVNGPPIELRLPLPDE